MNTKKIISSITVGAGAVILGLGLQYALADWSAAPSSPPSNNVAAPINVSSSYQAKVGGITLGSSVASTSIPLDVEGVGYAQALIVGKNIAKTFQYLDGNQGAGKVLTSDASGNASWQAGGGNGVIGGYEIYIYDGTISGAPTAGTAAGCRYAWGSGSCTSYSAATCSSGTAVHQYQSEDMINSTEGTNSSNGFSYVKSSPLAAGYYDVGLYICVQ